MAGLVPVIHHPTLKEAWITGSSPVMTITIVVLRRATELDEPDRRASSPVLDHSCGGAGGVKKNPPAPLSAGRVGRKVCAGLRT
jgi:hypothetical protein